MYVLVLVTQCSGDGHSILAPTQGFSMLSVCVHVRQSHEAQLHTVYTTAPEALMMHYSSFIAFINPRRLGLQ